MAAQSKEWSLAGDAGSNVCLSAMSVVCCQVEVSATGRSLVQRSPTDCGVPECDRGTSWRVPWPSMGCWAMRKIYYLHFAMSMQGQITRRLQQSIYVCVRSHACSWTNVTGKGNNEDLSMSVTAHCREAKFGRKCLIVQLAPIRDWRQQFNSHER